MMQLIQSSIPADDANRLIRLAEMLGLQIASEDLESLSKQLHLIDALERDELQDYAPILKMDADWHD